MHSHHQSLHHFVADAAWSDEQMLLRVAQWVVPEMDFSDGGWWIIDDTGFPEQGRNSVGVTGSVTVWPPGREPLPPVTYSGRGRVAKRLRLGGTALPQRHPQSIKQLAMELGPKHWHTVTWREGTNTMLCSRFARVRVRAAHRDHLREEVRPSEWLLIEWPKGDKEPLEYGLSTLPEDTPLQRMVYEAKMRWRIERDYQDLKQDLGLGQYEGRGWRGFHHYATLSIAAYGFLLAQRLQHPDEVGGKKTPRNAKSLPYPRITDLAEAQRAQRHVPSSSTSLRLRIGALLVRILPRCPCCLRQRGWQNY